MLQIDKKLMSDVKFNLPYVCIIALSSVIIYMTLWVRSLYVIIDTKDREMISLKNDEAQIFRKAFFQTNDILHKTTIRNESNTNITDNLPYTDESYK